MDRPGQTGPSGQIGDLFTDGQRSATCLKDVGHGGVSGESLLGKEKQDQTLDQEESMSITDEDSAQLP